MELMHRERWSITRALSTCLSKSPKTKPPCRFPLRSPYIEKDVPSPEPSLHIFKIPRKEASLQVPFSEPHRNRRSIPRTLLYLSVAVPGEKAPPPPGSPSGPRWREMLVTMAYSTSLSKFPIREPPSKFPSRPYGERRPSPGPSTHIIYKAQ
jgi:hypothetical protein